MINWTLEIDNILKSEWILKIREQERIWFKNKKKNNFNKWIQLNKLFRTCYKIELKILLGASLEKYDSMTILEVFE
jgi:hypothetical protein